MSYCPKCGTENAEEDNYCKHCGTNLTARAQDQTLPQNQTAVQKQTAGQDRTAAGATMEDEVESTVIKRLDGIKNKDESGVRALMDQRYNKYDDWSPFERQEATVALNNEFGAFKVLSDYSYELKDFEANVFGDVAVATFTLHYQGTMRNNRFNVTSRVTCVLRKENSGWKVVHEHYSRFPEERPRQFMQRRRGFRF
jgi:transcription initiation factor TFIIIB Brf1 subunit/transcription initiation factor TFIIB